MLKDTLYRFFLAVLFVGMAGSAFGLEMSSPGSASESAGVTWTGRTVAAEQWKSVAACPDEKLVVAVANTGATQRVATSEDSFNWILRTSPSNADWQNVTCGNGVFVAIAEHETVNPKVMTSPDGVNWTPRTAASMIREWKHVAHGKTGPGGASRFVAVADDGSSATGAVMYSDDNGVTWVSANASANASWTSVTYGANELWVAVAADSFPNQIMTSPDGIVWTNRASPENAAWKDVIHCFGKYIAVAFGGSGNRVMTSSDGITWVDFVSPISNWTALACGNGVVVAASTTDTDGSNQKVMTSIDGENWVLRTVNVFGADVVGALRWIGAAFKNGVFSLVSDQGLALHPHVVTSGFNIDPIW